MSTTMGGCNHTARIKVTRLVPSTHPSLVEQVTPRLPLDEAGCYRAGARPPKRPIPEGSITALHNYIRTDPHDLETIKLEICSLAWECGTDEGPLFLMAIEPSTGGTLFHTAIAARRFDLLDPLRDLFPPNQSFALQEKALWHHKNRHGETVLHTATKTGRLNLVIAAYNLFVGALCLDSGPVVADPWPDWGLSCEIHSVLIFLLERDKGGRDAAALARAQGFEHLALWIDHAVGQLDPDGRRHDPAEFQIWEEWKRYYYQHDYWEIPT